MSQTKNVLIVENGTDSLKINENAANNKKVLLSGIFTEFDIENRNKRFYKAENFIPCMNSLLEKKKMLGVLYGEFDHPDVFDIAGKNISHAIEDLTYNEASNRVDGTIALLSTHWGKEARAIINDGYPLFVSSRAAGVTDANGNVALKELFTYDTVVDPGFASAQVSVNESFGLGTTPDVHYRIYEMKTESDINNLYTDNKNDGKTKMDLKYMESLLADELVKLEFKIMSTITEGKSSSEDINSIYEKYELVNEELQAVKKYLEDFKLKFNSLVSKNEELTKANENLLAEVNENTLYHNHLANGLKKLNEYASDIETRLSDDEKMIEYVAEHTKANILQTNAIQETVEITAKFAEYVAKETELTQAFVESVAKETEVAQLFAESIAKETEVAQLFAESIAKETEITQLFVESVAKETEVAQLMLEHVATEANKDGIWLNYIAEKVDGIVSYTNEAVNKIKLTTPLNENSTEDSIHNMEDIVEYLGLNNETEIVNNVVEEEFTDNTTDVTETTEDVIAEDFTEETTEVEEVEPTNSVDGEEAQVGEEMPGEETEEPITDVTSVEPIEQTDATSTEMPEFTTSLEDQNTETEILQSLVKLFGTDETGVIISVEGDVVTIQKSGSDETVQAGAGEYEIIDTNENITDTVSKVLDEINKQKIVANQQPHFFTFLSENEIADFKALDNNVKESILIAMNENENKYFSSTDVLNIIGNVLKDKSMSYEEKLIGNVPANLTESWNGMSVEQKKSIITESKYFNLVTTADIKNFWNTRPFAKAITSPEAILIKESVNNVDNDKLDENYVEAFLKSIDNLK